MNDTNARVCVCLCVYSVELGYWPACHGVWTCKNWVLWEIWFDYPKKLQPSVGRDLRRSGMFLMALYYVDKHIKCLFFCLFSCKESCSVPTLKSKISQWMGKMCSASGQRVQHQWCSVPVTGVQSQLLMLSMFNCKDSSILLPNPKHIISELSYRLLPL